MTSPPSAPRVLLALGPVDVLADRAIADVMAVARAAAPEVERRDVDLASPQALGDLHEALSPSLFASDAVVQAAAAESITDDLVLAALLVAAADPPDGVWLTLRHAGGAKGKKIADALRKAGAAVVACDKPTRVGFEELMTAEFTRYGRHVEADARAALRVAIGDDVGLLFAAAAQLASDIEHDPISVLDVMAYYDGVADMPGYLISDAVWERRAADVVERTRWALLADAGIGPAITAAVLGGGRSLGKLSGVARGASDAETAGRIGAPPFKVRQLRRLASDWPPGLLAHALRSLAIADAAVKGRDARGRVLVEAGLDAEQSGYELERVLLKIAGNRD